VSFARPAIDEFPVITCLNMGCISACGHMGPAQETFSTWRRRFRLLNQLRNRGSVGGEGGEHLVDDGIPLLPGARARRRFEEAEEQVSYNRDK
jgi:hypothetical protein